MSDEISGPYLNAALFCEKILMEGDNVPTLVRIIDRFTINGTTPDMPATMLPLALFIAFKSGMFRGRSSIKLAATTPGGVELPAIEFPVNFEGDDDRGINIIANVGFQAQEEGLYWFTVLHQDQPLTRIALRVIYQRIATGPALSGT